MANTNKIPTIEITLDDGETYKAKCSLRVINQFQLMTGRDLTTSYGDPLNALEMTQLIACAIFPDNPQEKLNYVADNLGAGNIKTAINLVSLLVTGKTLEELTNKKDDETKEEGEASAPTKK